MIYISALLDGQPWNDLLRLRTQRVALALMVITSHTRANTRALSLSAVDELTFLDEVSESTLARAIASVLRRTVTRVGAALLRENTIGLNSEIAETLARACLSQRIVRSVEQLAAIMGYSRSEFTRRWNSCTPVGSQPHEFVEWLLLMHGLRIRSRTRDSWTRVAEQIGVKQETLGAICKRRFGVRLGQMQYLDRDRLLAVLWTILNRSAVDSRA